MGKFCPTPGNSVIIFLPQGRELDKKNCPGGQDSLAQKTFPRGCLGGGCTELELIGDCEVPVQETHEAQINLNKESREQKVKVIDKLHTQFAHPSSSRLLSLLKDAGLFDEDLKAIAEETSKGCNVCKRYKKTPARPVVSLPLATKFSEVVAMDLKEWKKGLYFLHLKDVATRFSLAAVIQNKTPSVHDSLDW